MELGKRLKTNSSRLSQRQNLGRERIWFNEVKRMKTIRLVVELINVPDECTAEKFRTKLEEGEFPSCIADNFGIVAANMADKNIEDLDNFQFTIYPFPEDEEDEFDDDEFIL